MNVVLAYAESNDSGSLNLVKILAGMGILAVTAILAATLIGISRARRHRQADAIMVVATFWGILAAGIAMYTAAAQYSWSKEYTTRIESGYYDPRDVSDKPKTPWIPLSSLGAGYMAILIWSLYRRDQQSAEG